MMSSRRPRRDHPSDRPGNRLLVAPERTDVVEVARRVMAIAVAAAHIGAVLHLPMSAGISAKEVLGHPFVGKGERDGLNVLDVDPAAGGSRHVLFVQIGRASW